MYYPDQVIFDLEGNTPVIIKEIWDPKDYPKYNTHMLCTNHDPVLKSESEYGPVFICRTCDQTSSITPGKKDNIYVGASGKGRLKIARKLFKEGRIKPSCTLEEEKARQQAEHERIEATKRATPEERAVLARKQREEYIKKVFPLYLRFQDHRARSDEYAICARDSYTLPEYMYRKVRNFRLQEEARREYLTRIAALQEELSNKYNPQFEEEDYSDKPISYAQRQAVHDEIWNTPRLRKLYKEEPR